MVVAVAAVKSSREEIIQFLLLHILLLLVLVDKEAEMVQKVENQEQIQHLIV